MKWTKVNNQWQCVFVNAPFKVILVDKVEFIKATLLFTHDDFWVKEIGSKTYASFELAKSEVHLFIIQQLAEYGNTVREEYIAEQVMTWRKLKQQLDEIPEDQLDLPIHHLDTDGYWVGEPRVVLAEQDQYAGEDDWRDVTDNTKWQEDHKLVVEKGKYFLSTCNV